MDDLILNDDVPSSTEVPYAELPPFPASPSTPDPARKSDPPATASDAEPEDATDETNEVEGDADDAVGASETPDQELARLREEVAQAEARIKAAQEYEQRIAEQQRAAYEKQVETYWATAQDQAEVYFTNRARSIYAEAENAIAPVAYIQQQMAALDAQRKQWYREFTANREAAMAQQVHRATYPAWVAEVADHFGLSDEEYEELFDYHPDEVLREADKMQRRRKEAESRRRSEAQKARAKKRTELADKLPQTGESGRALVGDPNMPKDSDEYYYSIPWERK